MALIDTAGDLLVRLWHWWLTWWNGEVNVSTEKAPAKPPTVIAAAPVPVRGDDAMAQRARAGQFARDVLFGLDVAPREVLIVADWIHTGRAEIAMAFDDQDDEHAHRHHHHRDDD